ncbi:hypothetical protein BDZ45DRAFT_749436 [Acephala macrosclerotiorum]|nr:hypothetical protein BDZ45DRAFT_749436 [Acephala macrosclerotiorum]
MAGWTKIDTREHANAIGGDVSSAQLHSTKYHIAPGFRHRSLTDRSSILAQREVVAPRLVYLDSDTISKNCPYWSQEGNRDLIHGIGNFCARKASSKPTAANIRIQNSIPSRYWLRQTIIAMGIFIPPRQNIVGNLAYNLTSILKLGRALNPWEGDTETGYVSRLERLLDLGQKSHETDTTRTRRKQLRRFERFEILA